MPNRTRLRLAALWLGGSALAGAAWVTQAYAWPANTPAAAAAPDPGKQVGDSIAQAVKPDDAGARTIADFIEAYSGKAVLPSVKITHDGDFYTVSLDLAAATAGLKGAGVTYDPVTIQLKVFQQADGQWRVEMGNLPPIVAHMTPKGTNEKGPSDVRIETTNYRHVTTLDPRLNWISEGHGGADKLSLTQHGPGLEQFVEIGGLKADIKTTSGATGLTMVAHEPIDTFNFVMDADPKGVDPATGGPSKPVHVSAEGKAAGIDVTLAEFQPNPLLDAWRFVAAHPDGATFRHDFAAFKPLLTALVGDHAKLDEAIALDSLNVLSSAGPIGIEGGAIGIGAVNNGADTGFSEHLAARSIKLPDGLVPPMYAPMVPTSFDVGFKATGFDLEAWAQEWLADANVTGDGPMFSKEAADKLAEKLIGTRPITVTIPPSHVHGAGLDLAFEGALSIENKRPTGTITLTMHDFDKTEQAVQALGPEAQQAVPVLAMAKGLGKAGADGSLVWVCSVSGDHIMKVNGLPLGKAPF